MLQLHFLVWLSLFLASAAFRLPSVRLPSLFLMGTSTSAPSATPTMASFYEITEKDAHGQDISFEQFRGKVVYGVNVATRCGYTASGYALLAKIAKMKELGVEVALFPCNQFMGQEPGTDEEIEQFCTLKGVEGANVFTKADVNGPNTRPTYQFLREHGVIGKVRWNFSGKFLVDKEGNVSAVKDESKLEEEIRALAAK